MERNKLQSFFLSHCYQVIVTNNLAVPNKHTISFIHSHVFADRLFGVQHYVISLGKNRKSIKIVLEYDTIPVPPMKRKTDELHGNA